MKNKIEKEYWSKRGDLEKQISFLEDQLSELSEWYIRKCLTENVTPDRVLNEDTVICDSDGVGYDVFKKGTKLYKLPKFPTFFEYEGKFYKQQYYGTLINDEVRIEDDTEEISKEEYEKENSDLLPF
jgi:hypothetical protein